MDFSVRSDCRKPNMRVFAVSCQSNHRFCLKTDFQTLCAENFFNNRAHEHFIIGCLDCIGEFPINFELFAHVSKSSGLINLRFKPANFFMTHFDAEIIFIEFD